MLSSRMRKASTSPSRRPPSGVAVPVRRATCPSTASSASATADRVTSAVIDTGRPNESATRPATPAHSTALVRVTQSAGSIAGRSLRMRAVASSAVAAEAGRRAPLSSRRRRDQPWRTRRRARRRWRASPGSSRAESSAARLRPPGSHGPCPPSTVRIARTAPPSALAVCRRARQGQRDSGHAGSPRPGRESCAAVPAGRLNDVSSRSV